MGITGTRAGTDVERAPASGAPGVARSAPRRAITLSIAGSLALAATGATAETWRFEPTLSILETLTNNVDLTPSSMRRGDLISEITPGFRVVEKGARTSLAGAVSVPILLYVNTGSENNQIYPQVNLVGNAELVERVFFVDGAINVSQQFLTPFAAQPDNLGNATDNRYTSQLYRVSPYIKGDAGGNISYELRNDNIWSNLGDAPDAVNGVTFNASNSYTNQTIGRLEREPLPLGWRLDYNRSDVKFTDQDRQLMELARLIALYRYDSTLQFGVSGGYERNDFPFSEYSGAIYGVGYRWRPSPIMSSDGAWEHRFFGSSYRFSFDYRTPLSSWEINASRNITTYPQQIAGLPAGGDVPRLLNAIFSSRIADPAERQRVVDQLIRDRGLPQTLTGPVNLYTQQVTLQDTAMARAGLLGARNSIFLTASYLRQEPIAGSGNPLPPELAGFNSNTQYGADVIWTHQLTPLVTLGANVSWSRTVPNEPTLVPGETQTLGATSLTTVGTFVDSPLSPRTSVYAGARYQVQSSNVPNNAFNEAAVYAGLIYRFR